ncbi:ANKRD50 [Symbiodinium natans]|uniref:ANKRD50 protein n=1 Tax=Symbiodinium natans TaxID=878477 RepID=A0A812HDV2_9DINO|nr:ANKRD50 [Symbiodinium natans]
MDPAAQMVCVRMASGEDLAVIPCKELSTVRALKEKLQALCGVPRFRQRLLLDGRSLGDEVKLQEPADLQLVLVSFFEASDAQQQDFATAIANGFQRQVEEALCLPQDPNCTFEQIKSFPATPLNIAAAYGHVGVMRLLLEARAIVNNLPNSSASPLLLAARVGQQKAIRLLLNAGARADTTDSDQRTALWYASRLGDPRNVRLLLEAKANPSTRDREGKTPLHMANGNLAIARRLSYHKWSRHRAQPQVARAVGGEVYEFEGGHEVPLDEAADQHTAMVAHGGYARSVTRRKRNKKVHELHNADLRDAALAPFAERKKS